MKTFDELKHAISIMEFAAANGYAMDKKKGMKYPVMNHANGDRIVIIDAANTTQGYFNPCDDRDKGSLINFVKNRLGWLFIKDVSKSELANVSLILHEYLNIPVEIRSACQLPVSDVKRKIRNRSYTELDITGLQPLTDTTYLQSRCISQSTFHNNLFKDRIFNHPAPAFKNNIGFIYTDTCDHTVGIEVRNTHLKKFLRGSNRSVALWRSNFPERLECILFFESPIDALSHYELKRNNNALHIAFGGQLATGQLQTAKTIVEKITVGKEVRIFSCFDNDIAGESFTRKLQEYFKIAERKIPAFKKDFNDFLQYLQKSTTSRPPVGIV